MTKDMTSGAITPLLIKFTIPLVLGNLFQLTYNAADSIIVGKFVGEDALAAVGTSNPLMPLAILFNNGMCLGAGILVSTAFGAGDTKLVERQVSTTAIAGTVFSLTFSALCVLLADPLLRLLQVPAANLPIAVNYLRIVFAGLIYTFFYNFLAATMRALGDSKSPVWFLAAASAINIVLDLLTVCVLGMGVAGAAIATVVSQLGSGLLCVAYLKKRFPILHMEKDDWKTSRPEAMRLLGMGVPVGLQFSITAIGSVILQSAVNSLGAVCVSGVAVAGKIYTLLACPFDALAMAATNFTGQNLGAGKYARIKQGTYACMFIGILYCVLFVLIAQFGTRYLALLFMNADEAASVMDYTQQLSVAFAYATPLLLAVNVLRLSIQGMGYSRVSLISGLLEMLARTVVSLWAVPAFGFDAACLASPFAWLLADCFLIPAFYGCLNARRRQAARVQHFFHQALVTEGQCLVPFGLLCAEIHESVAQTVGKLAQ